MTTLLAVYTSKGCVGRCDANCYLGTHKRCKCICGGRNHGVGLQQARENMRAFLCTTDDLERFAGAHELQVDQLTVIDRSVVPDARAAREIAYLRLNQLELPLGLPDAAA